MKSMHKFLSRVLLVGVITLAIVVSSPVLGQPTAVDPTFNAVPSVPLATGTNLQQLLQLDGKILVFGTKVVVDGVAKSDVVRLNADGSPDPTFSYCGCGLHVVRNAMLAAGGKIIVAGIEENSAKMIRVNPDGSIDPAFVAISPGPLPFLGGAEFSVNAVQPDGKVLATRRYSSAGHTSYTFSRYNSDGTLDSGFTSIALAAGSPVSAFVRAELLPDGRFYLAVTSGVNATAATLRRHNADGSMDPTWEPPSFQSAPGSPMQVTISDVAVNSDGTILVAGNWNTVNGVERRNLVRHHSVGNVDLSFVSPTVQAGNG